MRYIAVLIAIVWLWILLIYAAWRASRAYRIGNLGLYLKLAWAMSFNWSVCRLLMALNADERDELFQQSVRRGDRQLAGDILKYNAALKELEEQVA